MDTAGTAEQVAVAEAPDNAADEDLPVLPDDVLILVFAFLPARDVFSARVVCRRWAALALHPDVWHDRELDEKAERGVCKAALRLAPCIQRLRLAEDDPPLLFGFGFGDRGPPRPPPGESKPLFRSGTLLASTHCAVRTLKMGVSPNCAAAAATALNRQVALGRLRGADIHMENVTIDPYRVLGRAALAASGLTELTLCFSLEHPNWVPRKNDGGAKDASLKKLACTYEMENDGQFAVLRYLLGRHAPTLEVLVLEFNTYSVPFPWDVEVPSAADLLVRLVGLRELQCPVMRGMPALARCPRLEALTLSLWWPSEEDALAARCSGIREYLRGAARLRRLELRPRDLEADLDEMEQRTEEALSAADLVRELACSPGPSLEVLWLRFPFHAHADALRVLIAALPKLAALRELRLWTEPRSVLPLLHCLAGLRRDAGEEAPGLLLHVEQDIFDRDDGDSCWHGWRHRDEPELKRCFQANPGLHVKVDEQVRFRCEAAHPCAECRRGRRAAECCSGVGRGLRTARGAARARGAALVLFGHAVESHPSCGPCRQSDGRVVCERIA